MCCFTETVNHFHRTWRRRQIDFDTLMIDIQTSRDLLLRFLAFVEIPKEHMRWSFGRSFLGFCYGCFYFVYDLINPIYFSSISHTVRIDELLFTYSSPPVSVPYYLFIRLPCEVHSR